MTEFDIIVLLLIPLGWCFFNWHAGIYICIAVGFLQDPLRKSVPEEPVYFTVLIVPFLVATLAGAYRQGIRFNLDEIHDWNNVLRSPLNLFVGLVILQSGNTFVRTGSPILAGIGLMAYLTPLPGILLGYQFGKNQQEIINLAKIYLVISAIMISGVFFSYAGFEWSVLRSVGEGLYAFSPDGDFLILHSGFLRSPEVAAWHACTAICFALLLVLIKQRWGGIHWFSGGLMVFFGIAILLTGRRKFLMEIFIFVSIYAVLLIWFRRGAIQSTIALIFTLASGLLIVTYLLNNEFNTNLSSYYERGATVQRDAAERTSLMTIESFQWVLEQNGPWGAGAGTGSQGSQHFGGGTEIVGGAAEGGLGKVLAELGMPGLILLLWLMLSFARYAGSILKHVKTDSTLRAKLTFWLFSFQMANAFVYIVAHQVFGDIFVLVILGFTLGFILAIPKMQNVSDAAVTQANSKYPQGKLINQPVPLRSQF